MRQQDITLRITYDEGYIKPPQLWNWPEVIKTDELLPQVIVLNASKERDYAPEGTESPRQGLLDLN